MSFVKWMGGKSKVLHLFKDYFPNFNNISGYIEPFVGGGSVFFYLKENGFLNNKQVYLSDINNELITTYKVVRDDPNELMLLLEKYEKLNCRKYYNDVRKRFPPGIGMTNIEKAAAFIYLTTTAFGGQWRVNSKGKFNKSYSGNDNIVIANDNILHYSKLLQETDIRQQSFEKILELETDLENYFIYADPPYYNTNSVCYAKDGFGLNTRMLIPKIFKKLNELGCKVMMSNADCPIIYDIFKDYNITKIYTNVINTNRNNIKLGYNETEKLVEVVVTNYQVSKKQKNIEDAWM